MAEEQGLTTPAKATYVFSVDELMKGVRLHLWHHRRGTMLVLPILGTLWLSLWIAYFLDSERTHNSWAPMGTLLSILFIISPILSLWESRRKVAKIPTIDKEMTWWVDDKGISARGEGHDFSAAWSTAYAALVSPKGILVYPQKELFYWIPATAFPSPGEWERARNFVIKNGPRCKTV